MRTILALVLLITLANWPKAALFEVHSSTRVVTCLSPHCVGTTGGLRRLGQDRVELPGVAIRGICEEWLATDCGLYRMGKLVTREPACSVLVLPSGIVASGHLHGKIAFGNTSQSVAPLSRGGPPFAVQCQTPAPIHSLAWDGSCLWAASLDGLWEIGAEGPRRVSVSREPLSGTVTALVARDGVLCVGTAAGVFRRRGSDWERVGEFSVSALALGPKGEVYAGTLDEGVFLEGKRMLGMPSGVTALLWTAQGLLVGTPHGAFRGGKPVYSFAGEIVGNHIAALACDATGVYMGTFQDGLGDLQGNVLLDEWVNQLAFVGGALTARLSDGSVVRRNGAWKPLGRVSGWPKDWTSWLGTAGVGTLSGVYEPVGTGWRIRKGKALQGVMVTAMTRCAGESWVGSQSGLYCGERRVDVSDSWITCLESFRGQVYAGTFRGGLCIGGKEGFRTEAIGRVHCLLASSRGVWVGTPTGLLFTDGRSWKRFGVDQGMSSDTVWSLAARGDELWVGTDAGLCLASEQCLLGL